jgi:hypothetical protein
MKFNEYLFSEMERLGIVKDYAKNPHTGKGRKPVGNLSVNSQRIFALKQATDLDSRVWGLIAYGALLSEGQFGTKSINELDRLNDLKIKAVVIKSAQVLHQTWVTKFKKN